MLLAKILNSFEHGQTARLGNHVSNHQNFHKEATRGW
jgi:hypothetical protein